MIRGIRICMTRCNKMNKARMKSFTNIVLYKLYMITSISRKWVLNK